PTRMGDVVGTLKATYRAVVGSDYPRDEPRPAEALADTLNNRALSLVDLGKRGEAVQRWQEALAHHPRHPRTTHDLGLRRWRSGRIPEEGLLSELTAVCQAHPGEERVLELLGHVHLERGDCESALQVLGEGAEVAAGCEDVQQLWKLAGDLLPGSCRLL